MYLRSFNNIAEDQQFLNLENVNHADYPYHAGKNAAEVMDGNSAYPTVERMSTLWLEQCNSFEDSTQEDELPDVNPVLAIENEDQRYALTFVLHYLRQWHRHLQEPDSFPRPKQVRLAIQGLAGVGKSFLIKNIELMTKMLFAEKNSSVIATPTGCAAFNAGGSTLHSLFRLSTNSEKEPEEINQQKLIRLQNEFEHLKVLQIDEFSMVGKRLLGKTQHVVGLSCNESSSPSFGSIPIVIMYGDWCQLPPVLDKPLFARPVANEGSLCKLGARAYRSFKDNLIMEKPVRQSDPVFKGHLKVLRDGIKSEG